MTNTAQQTQRAKQLLRPSSALSRFDYSFNSAFASFPSSTNLLIPDAE